MFSGVEKSDAELTKCRVVVEQRFFEQSGNENGCNETKHHRSPLPVVLMVVSETPESVFDSGPVDHRLCGVLMLLTFNHVDRKSAACGFLIFFLHVFTCLTHGLDDFIEGDKVGSISGLGNAGGVDGFDRSRGSQ